jgi:hypothetical protein
MAVKMKPVGASEIKDIRIAREVIAQIRKERSPEEWAAIRKAQQERIDFFQELMAK